MWDRSFNQAPEEGQSEIDRMYVRTSQDEKKYLVKCVQAAQMLMDKINP